MKEEETMLPLDYEIDPLTEFLNRVAEIEAMTDAEAEAELRLRKAAS